MSGIKLTFTPTAPRRLGTIFVVDDNPIERSMLMDYFEKYPGIEVKGFPNGDDCLKEIILFRSCQFKRRIGDPGKIERDQPEFSYHHAHFSRQYTDH